MKAYSEDLRKRVIGLRQEGESAAVVARRFRLNVRTVERYWKRYRESGQIAPRKHGGYLKSKLAVYDMQLLGWIKRERDLTLQELRQRCGERFKLSISVHALWYRLKHIGLSFKKNDARLRARPA